MHLFMADFTSMARRIAKECSGLRIRQASRLLSRVYDECLRPSGLQESQLAILVAVAMHGENGAGMGSLAKVLVMDRTTVTRSVVPLEKSGLLRVARSADDARARVILLTAAGERMIEKAYPMWEEAQARVKKVLGAARFDALRAQLSDVIGMAGELEGVEG